MNLSKFLKNLVPQEFYQISTHGPHIHIRFLE